MVQPMAGDEGMGPLERVHEVIALSEQIKRDGDTLADGICATTVRETVCAMAVIARSSGLLKFALMLDDEEFTKLMDELIPEHRDKNDAKDFALRHGHVRLITCNGLTLVMRSGGGTKG